MEEIEDFYTQLAKEHEINRRNYLEEQKMRRINAEPFYTDFICWCNAFNHGEGQNDAKIFAKFLKEENIELNFWQKKHLAEKYFGYFYAWNGLEEKWEILKKEKEK